MGNNTGIYKIVNIKNGKVYVGSAVDIKRRWLEHKILLIKGIHHSKYLQNSFNKEGIENFLFEVVEECPKDSLIEREQYWIDLFNSHNDGYNSNPKAGNSLGRKHSEETKQKMSNSRRGKKLSEEHKKKLGEKSKGNKNNLGKKQSKETIEKRVIKTIGRKNSEETKQKMSEAQKGKSKSEEHKRKISESLKNKKINQNILPLEDVV